MHLTFCQSYVRADGDATGDLRANHPPVIGGGEQAAGRWTVCGRLAGMTDMAGLRYGNRVRGGVIMSSYGTGICDRNSGHSRSRY